MNLDAFFRDYITTWEGGLSLDPDDAGNWLTLPGGHRALIGSNHGVTGAVLAKYRGAPVITAKDIAGLTLDEAVKIGEALFYRGTGLDLLPFDPGIASAVDFGWGAGPRQAVLLLQRLIGVADDGQIGDYTITAYHQWIASHDVEACARLWQRARDDFYRLICAKRPINAKYLKGWMRRSAYFAPGTPWWKAFVGAKAA